MKDMGMEKIIFGKRNTITEENGWDFYNDNARYAFRDAVEAFGIHNVIVIGNAMN